MGVLAEAAVASADGANGIAQALLSIMRSSVAVAGLGELLAIGIAITAVFRPYGRWPSIVQGAIRIGACREVATVG